MPVSLRQRNIQARQTTKKVLSSKITKKNSGLWKTNKKISTREMLVTNAPTDSTGIMYVSRWTSFYLLVVARLIAALYSHITDCDETYNYWEPLHYLVYGSGMQTWEYSPEFAIRSYAPLGLIAAVVKLLGLHRLVEPVALFYLVRCALAVATAAAEAMFYRAACYQFGVNVGRMWLAVALTSPGGFISSAALLPSAWCAGLATAALACEWVGRPRWAIAYTAISSLVSWPFAGLLGAPIAIDILFYQKAVKLFITCCSVCLAVIVPILIAVDSWFYGKIVLAPWNIVKYNIFTEHGPDLYGVEPWTFYLLNGFLNFNIIWVLALMCPAWLCVCWLVTEAKPRLAVCQPYWLAIAPLYLWLAVFVAQPHKEERFLFPVYSMIYLCGAISIDCIQKITFSFKMLVDRTCDRFLPEKTEKLPSKNRHYLSHTRFVMIIFLAIATLGGISRSVALYRNYSAPMSILRPLPPARDVTNVCFGKDWYRSPSSFHLPENYRVRFVKSEFRGQMPAQYAETDNATRIVPEHFNDHNKEDARTYLRPSQCHYLVDSDIEPSTPLQPIYAGQTDQWETIAKLPLLNSAQSHRLFRAFYVPYFNEYYTTFGSLYLLRNKQLVDKIQ